MQSPLDTPLQIEPADCSAPESLRLIEALRAELSELYPEINGSALSAEEISGERAVFILASLGEKVIACGAVRPFAEGNARIAEIKRMYVEPAARHHGVGRAILDKLEELARAGGYHTARLETGLRQPAAIHLYESAGYRRIEPYGRYADDPLSVCFEKSLFLAAESDL